MSDLFGNHIVGFPTRWLKYPCSLDGYKRFFIIKNLEFALYQIREYSQKLSSRKHLGTYSIYHTHPLSTQLLGHSKFLMGLERSMGRENLIFAYTKRMAHSLLNSIVSSN